MKKTTAVLLALSLDLSYADEVYRLRQGESVSSLLVKRLKIKTIYSNKYMDQILKYNNLDLESARRLSIGKEIKIPKLVSEAISKEETPIIEVVEAPKIESTQIEEDSTNIEKWLRLGGKIENLRGNNLDDTQSSDFSLNIIRPIVGLGMSLSNEKNIVNVSVDGSFVKLTSDTKRKGRDQFPLFDTRLGYLRKINDQWRFGAVAKLGQEIYVELKSTNHYELQNPWIFGVGPSLAYKDFGISTLFTPNQKFGNTRTTKDNYSLFLNYKVYHNLNFWDFEGSFSNISYHQSDASNFGFKILYHWSL